MERERWGGYFLKDSLILARDATDITASNSRRFIAPQRKRGGEGRMWEVGRESC